MEFEIKPGTYVAHWARIGRVVRLVKRYRTDGADVQFAGKPFTEWVPLANLSPVRAD